MAQPYYISYIYSLGEEKAFFESKYRELSTFIANDVYNVYRAKNIKDDELWIDKLRKIYGAFISLVSCDDVPFSKKEFEGVSGDEGISKALSDLCKKRNGFFALSFDGSAVKVSLQNEQFKKNPMGFIIRARKLWELADRSWTRRRAEIIDRRIANNFTEGESGAKKIKRSLLDFCSAVRTYFANDIEFFRKHPEFFISGEGASDALPSRQLTKLAFAAMIHAAAAQACPSKDIDIIAKYSFDMLKLALSDGKDLELGSPDFKLEKYIPSDKKVTVPIILNELFWAVLLAISKIGDFPDELLSCGKANCFSVASVNVLFKLSDKIPRKVLINNLQRFFIELSKSIDPDMLASLRGREEYDFFSIVANGMGEPNFRKVCTKGYSLQVGAAEPQEYLNILLAGARALEKYRQQHQLPKIEEVAAAVGRSPVETPRETPVDAETVVGVKPVVEETRVAGRAFFRPPLPRPAAAVNPAEMVDNLVKQIGHKCTSVKTCCAKVTEYSKKLRGRSFARQPESECQKKSEDYRNAVVEQSVLLDRLAQEGRKIIARMQTNSSDVNMMSLQQVVNEAEEILSNLQERDDASVGSRFTAASLASFRK